MTFKNFVYFTREEKAMPIEEVKEEIKRKMVEEGTLQFMKEAGIQAFMKNTKYGENEIYIAGMEQMNYNKRKT